MATTERVTVTLPIDLIAGIDRFERNRSRFIAQAVAHELLRRRHEALLRSLASPHPEVGELVESSLADWAAGLSAQDGRVLNETAGKAVRWVEGRGWVEELA
jgi:hypothetical protein